MKPNLSVDEARQLALERFGIEGAVTPLASYIDQNFKVTLAQGEAYVLKVASADESEAFLRCQDRLLVYLREGWNPDWPVASFPSPMEDLAGQTVSALEHGGKTHWVRLVTFLEGIFLADFPTRPGLLMEQLGRFLGRLDRVLEGFSETPPPRDLIWDLANFHQVETFLEVFPDTQRLRMEGYFSQVNRELKRRSSQLAKGWIHGDANQHNVLLGGNVSLERSRPEDVAIRGVIDFGDLSHTAVIYELAIAAAYAMLEQRDPWSVLVPLVRGYGSVRPITPDEAGVLASAIAGRLITSLTLGMHQSGLDPDNEYISTNQRPAWSLLDLWMEEGLAELSRNLCELCANSVRESNCGAEDL